MAVVNCAELDYATARRAHAAGTDSQGQQGGWSGLLIDGDGRQTSDREEKPGSLAGDATQHGIAHGWHDRHTAQ